VVRNNLLTNDERSEPFRVAAIIAYSRPFGKSRGYQQLSARFEQFARDEFTSMHNQIIDLRDKCVAHSDREMNKVIRISDEGTTTLRTQGHYVKSRTLYIKDFGLFRDLCQQQLDRVKHDIENRVNKGAGGSQ
jgi:hypothetical protein